MILLSAEKITKSYSEKILLNEVSLFLNENDKIGIIGVNGTGKTTFLNILSEIEFADSGNIIKSAGVRISYLEQNPIIDHKISILENVFLNADNATRQTKEYEAKSILTKLGFKDLDIKATSFSGGEKKRVAIARALVKPCEILILDEPTNHLDNVMVTWLENYLKSYKGAIVMVTHDRYFLDRVTNRIIEIEKGALYSYSANYSKFLELKIQREEMEIATQRKNKSIYRREHEWMLQGPQGRGTKSKSRIQRFEILDKGKVEDKDLLKMDSISSRLGKKIVEIDNISKSFGSRKIVNNFSYNVFRDDRVGIVGENGTGKSTLIKMIGKILEPDTGKVIHGDTVKIGYITQEWEIVDVKKKVIDYIKDVAEMVVTNDGVITASKMLERFLFTSDIQWNTISKLSGGEKRRLYILRELMLAPNILLLDEPTNDLDIETLNILEEYIESFQGAVIIISHDRYFLDKVVDKIFEFRENGELKQYNGGYSDYIYRKEIEDVEIVASANAEKQQKNRQTKTPTIKFTFQEKKDFENIESEMSEIEKSISILDEKIGANSANYEQLIGFTVEKENLEALLFSKMERWEYLSELWDSIK